MEESFHCISVDGHMSTNDTVLLLANGAASDEPAPAPLSGKALEDFRTTLFEVCEDLAQSIPADGEGATHLITVEVHGCRNRPDALQIGKTIADSPLVKTAIAGADPNWGRIVSAAGYAGVQFDPSKVTLYLNGLLLLRTRRTGRFRRRHRGQINRRRSRHEHRAHSRRRQSVRPLLDDRSHRRVRAAERRLSHVRSPDVTSCLRSGGEGVAPILLAMPAR